MFFIQTFKDLMKQKLLILCVEIDLRDYKTV